MIGDDPFGLSSWRKIGRGLGRIGRWIPYVRAIPNCIDALTGGADGANSGYYSDCFAPFQDCSSGLTRSQSCQQCVTNRAAKAGVMQGVPGFGIGIPEAIIGIIKPPLAIIGAIDLVCTFKNLQDIKDMFNELHEKCERLKD